MGRAAHARRASEHNSTYGSGEARPVYFPTLDKVFLNQDLSEAFVQNINKHRDRFLNPIMDYRIQSFISDYSNK
jgi:hypothetical protein